MFAFISDQITNFANMLENDTIKLSIPYLVKRAIDLYPDNNALAFVDEKPITYQQMGFLIKKCISFLKNSGIEKQDRVAIWALNSPQWAIAYLAITGMGAVVVPILPDVLPSDVKTILQHSDSKLIFASTTLSAKLTEDVLTEKCQFAELESILLQIPSAVEALDDDSFGTSEEDLAAIIYTSGTTGRAKGVMLSHRNIAHVAWYSATIQPITPNDRFLSVLPMAHTYENSLGLLLGVFNGACMYYLRKAPTASVLLPALEHVRPTIMLSVPLIIEKMFRLRILPQLTKSPLLKFLYNISAFRKILHAVAGKKLYKTFGGEIKFFGIGGAKLNPIVERFLKEAHFPYAIGYGLTESSPLLAGASPQKVRPESTGPALHGVKLKIHEPNPENGEGEIWASGPNVMMGYYREPELTAEVLTSDGWLRTGDLGRFDQDGYLYIRGRLKNVIVGSSGKNIYPEEIEAMINNHQFVAESLVVERKGKLVALVQLNMEEMEKHFQSMYTALENKKEELVREIQQYVNTRVNQLSQLQAVLIQAEPFEKTATQKIKRFLYH